MMRAFARWLFMRTHRAELIDCARFVRSDEGIGNPFSLGQRDGVLVALERLGLLV